MEAFRQLVLAYSNPVIGFLYHLVGDYERALDLGQETFLRLFKTLANDPNQPRHGHSCRKLMFTIARNLARDEWRRRKARREVRLSDDVVLRADSTPSPDVVIAKKEMQHRVWAALQTLPHETQELLIWREMNGLRYEEIADILNIPLGTVKSRMNRARLAFKEAYFAQQRSEGPRPGKDAQETRSTDRKDKEDPGGPKS